MTKIQQREMANRIKAQREILGFTQEGFAETIALSYSSYSKIENAFQNPALDTLIKIAQHLGMSLDYLVFGDDASKETCSDDIIRALLKNADSEKLLYSSRIFSQIANVLDNNKKNR